MAGYGRVQDMSIKSKVLKEIEKKPRRLKELKAKLGNDKKVSKAVDELFHEKLVSCRQGLYSAASIKQEHAIQCKIVKLGRTFGFAKPEDGSLDVFIPGSLLMGAMTGDIVMVAISEHPRVAGSVEGEVVAVVNENNRFVGTVDVINGHMCLVPDACTQTPLHIKKSADGGVKKGEKAAAEILERGNSHEEHRVGIAMRFGLSDEAAQCAKAILYGEGINRSFPQSVKNEAKKLENAEIGKFGSERTDLRADAIFTIDAASTKDIDDAISISKNADGYTLGVHIADVSNYVKPNSALDKEAFSRGTSVYYADSVVPMLPRQLSNGICSLNEKEDRFAFSCIMDIDKDGRTTHYAFKKTVIRSRVKGVYTEINSIFDGTADKETKEKYSEVSDELNVMHELYEKLAALRAKRGSMDIESNEAKLVIDDNGKCVGVIKRERGESEQMIEEFMLLANSCAANYATELKIPFVYRVHETPDPERIAKLKSALTAAGVPYSFEKEQPSVLELSALLEATRGTPIERFVHTNILRSMAKAKYEPQAKGHFGLALADYAHFTSPIRRYPDLAIHRILSDVTAGVPLDDISIKYAEFAGEASAQSSDRELAAMKAERDIDECYKAEYMQQYIGDEFDAVISSVTSFGVYVELPNTVEGLIRSSSLSDKPLTLTEGVCLKDALTGKSWRLGGALKVKLTAVDVSKGNLDFEPVE